MNFKKSLINLPHIEHRVFDSYRMLDETVSLMENLFGMLKGTHSGDITIQAKFDGAPNLIFGIDPTDGEFFVTTKKIFFTKNYVVFKSVDEILNFNDEKRPRLKKALESGLAIKLIKSYRHLAGLGFGKEGVPKIVGGDYLFSDDSLKKTEINGEELLEFQPNLIAYTTDPNSPIGRFMSGAKIGVATHTEYKGEWPNLEAFPLDAQTPFERTADVFQAPVNYDDLSGVVTLSQSESSIVFNKLKEIRSIMTHIGPMRYQELYANYRLTGIARMAMNRMVAGYNPVGDNMALQQLVVAVKQEAMSHARTHPRAYPPEALKNDYNIIDTKAFRALLSIYVEIYLLKTLFLKKINILDKFKTFIKGESGYLVTNNEGLVVTDHPSKNTVKLVDRLNFTNKAFDRRYKKGLTK